MERYGYTLTALLDEDAELIRMLNNVTAADGDEDLGDEGW